MHVVLVVEVVHVAVMQTVCVVYVCGGGDGGQNGSDGGGGGPPGGGVCVCVCV